MNHFFEIAVPVPLPQSFTYSYPSSIKLGTRIEVSFGRQKLIGVVLKEVSKPQVDFKIVEILRVIDESPQFSQQLLILADWMARYYLCPIGEVFKAMTPPAPDNKARKFKLTQPKNSQTDLSVPQKRKLTPAQQHALKEFLKFGLEPYYKPVLLHGITGSGKTEVFLHVIDHFLLSQSSQILVLVPEISLTPQMVDIFTARFGHEVAVVHSKMSAKDRWAELDRIRNHSARILIGPRSAIFANFKNLSLIVIDEEHDSSYKQSSQFMYHARDVAIVRANLEKCSVILSSATPCLESYHNALAGKFHLVEMPNRISAHGLPKIELVPTSQDFYKPLAISSNNELDSTHVSPFSMQTLLAIRENFLAGGQAIVIVNRRGFANYVYSKLKNSPVECPQCSVSLVLHGRKKTLQCHYCDYQLRLVKLFEKYPEDKFYAFGSGSEKAENFLAEAIPELKIKRLDSDVAAEKNYLENTLSEFRNHTIDVLVGTQMLAKGHDFPKVTLVCLVEVDQLLAMPDFRGGEKTFQLLVQASGRAGRASDPGKVIIQTARGEHPIIRAAMHHNYGEFFAREKSFREKCFYPPFCRVILIELNSFNETVLRKVCIQVEGEIRKLYETHARELEKVILFGPTIPAISIIRKRHRRHFYMSAPQSELVHIVATKILQVLQSCPAAVRVKVDVDPQSIL